MELDTIICADCVEWLNARDEPFADLIFADPPFNIGYKYDVYEDRRVYDEYYAWTAKWMEACKRVLKPAGTFWVAIGDEYAAEVRMIARKKLDLHLRNWVIWHYTFGQNTKRKFARSHAHLFYFVKDPANFTFNDLAVRTFSDRQRVYRDKRANKAGRIPDDTWSEFPRVCGTFGEREGWHPCQMPETVLTRIVRTCSRAGDTVLDPFAGSGTTLAAAKRLSRRFLGIELSENYVGSIRERLAEVEPLAETEKRARARARWPEPHVQELRAMYMEAALATDVLHGNPHLLECFAQQFNWRLAESGSGREYSPREIWSQLEHQRKQARLPKIKVHADEPRSRRVRSLQPKLFQTLP